MVCPPREATPGWRCRCGKSRPWRWLAIPTTNAVALSRFVTAGVAFGVFLAARAAVICRRRRQQAHAAIAARADYEHAALLRGDVLRGTFRAL
jgi:hypothetical protein